MLPERGVLASVSSRCCPCQEQPAALPAEGTLLLPRASLLWAPPLLWLSPERHKPPLCPASTLPRAVEPRNTSIQRVKRKLALTQTQPPLPPPRLAPLGFTPALVVGQSETDGSRWPEAGGEAEPPGTPQAGSPHHSRDHGYEKRVLILPGGCRTGQVSGWQVRGQQVPAGGGCFGHLSERPKVLAAPRRWHSLPGRSLTNLELKHNTGWVEKHPSLPGIQVRWGFSPPSRPSRARPCSRGSFQGGSPPHQHRFSFAGPP